MLAFGVIGFIVAPGGPGSTQTSSGNGSAGTRQDPTAFWSGPVSCEWQLGQDSSVRQVVGFEGAVSDPAVVHALRIAAGSKVMAIILPPTTSFSSAALAYGDDRDHLSGGGSTLTLEGLSGNESSGTAVASGAAIVFAWSCSQGP